MTLPVSFRPKLVVTKHNSFPIARNIIAYWRYRRWTDAVITVCSKQATQYKQNRYLNNVSITNIANGVDLKYFRPPKERASSSRDVRHKLGIPDTSLVFVSCAGTATHKGWQYLASACDGLPNIHVIVLGGVPSNQKLHTLFPNGVPHNLVFPGQQTDVRPFLWAADIGFVLSTAVETISFACREMMATGLPMLVSDFGCLPENVDEKTGWVTKAGDTGAVQEIVSKISSYNIQEMGIAARLRAERLFDVETFRSETYKIYAEVLGE